MTDQEINAKIAELCGLAEVKMELWCGKGSELQPTYLPPDGEANKACRQLVPNYVSDLNAMHSAELSLYSEQYGKFMTALEDEIASTVKMVRVGGINLPVGTTPRWYSASA